MRLVGTKFYVSELASANVGLLIEADARAHRRGDVQGADVLALGAGRLGAHDGVDQRAQVLHDLVFVEADFADRHVDHAGLVEAELDAAALDLFDGAADVGGDGARARVGHQPARAEDFAEPTDRAHHVGRRHGDVEVCPARLDALDQIVRADDVRASRFGFARLVALGERDDALGAARARGQDGRAAHDLIGVARIETGANVQLDRFVELGDTTSP